VRIASFDAVLIATDHDSVDYRTLVDHSRLVVDTRNICWRNGIVSDKIAKGRNARDPWCVARWALAPSAKLESGPKCRLRWRRRRRSAISSRAGTRAISRR